MTETQTPQIEALVSHAELIETRTLRGMFTDRMVVTIDGETFATRPANFHERETGSWPDSRPVKKLPR